MLGGQADKHRAPHVKGPPGGPVSGCRDPARENGPPKRAEGGSYGGSCSHRGRVSLDVPLSGTGHQGGPGSPLGFCRKGRARSLSAACRGLWDPRGPLLIISPPSGAAAEVPEPEPLGQGHTQHGESPPPRPAEPLTLGLQRHLPSVQSGEAPGTPLTPHRPCHEWLWDLEQGPSLSRTAPPGSTIHGRFWNGAAGGRHSLALLGPDFSAPAACSPLLSLPGVPLCRNPGRPFRAG